MERLINAKVDTGRLALMWLGGGGFVLKPHSGDIIVIDPNFSESSSNGNGKRANGTGAKARNISVDYLFLTNDNPSTADADTLADIAQRSPDLRIVCPPSCCPILARLGIQPDRIDTVTAGQHIEFPNFSAHATPALFTEDSVGYVFEFDQDGANPAEVSAYYTGHTIFDPTLVTSVADYGPDVLILPIGERDGSLGWEDGAQLASLIAPMEAHAFDDAPASADGAFEAFQSHLASLVLDKETVVAVEAHVNTCHLYCPAEALSGHYAKKRARRQHAWEAHRSHQYDDGLRDPAAIGGQQRRM